MSWSIPVIPASPGVARTQIPLDTLGIIELESSYWKWEEGGVGGNQRKAPGHKSRGDHGHWRPGMW